MPCLETVGNSNLSDSQFCKTYLIRLPDRAALVKWTGKYFGKAVTSGYVSGRVLNQPKPMSRQLCILIIGLLLIFFFAGVFALVQGPRDPELQGKRLSIWIKEFNPWNWPIKPEAQVLRHSGSAAEPLLKHMLRSRDSSVERKLIKLLSKQSVIKIQFHPASVSQIRALEVCNLLGVQVKGTVPEIEALVNDYPTRLKNAMIASNALNTLAVMGPDGNHGLIRALTNQNAFIRLRAAELLGTSPFSGGKEVIAALTKCQNEGDASLQNIASRSLLLIKERLGGHLAAAVTDWNGTVDSSAKSPFGVWDISQGIRILSDSGLEQGEGTMRAEDLFGGNLSESSSGETGSAIFQDSQPDGFTHFIEWETPAPVTVRSFGLIASHDAAFYGFQRAFRSFRLLARHDASEPFTLVYAENIPVPYGEGPFSCMLYLFRNLETPLLARQFRVEFVQNGQGPWHGPRAIELYGFGDKLNAPMVMAALQNQEAIIRDEARELLHK